MNPRGLLMSASRVMGKLWFASRRASPHSQTPHSNNFYTVISIVFRTYLPELKPISVRKVTLRAFKLFRFKLIRWIIVPMPQSFVTLYPWTRCNKPRNHCDVCHFNSFSIKWHYKFQVAQWPAKKCIRGRRLWFKRHNPRLWVAGPSIIRFTYVWIKPVGKGFPLRSQRVFCN